MCIFAAHTQLVVKVAQLVLVGYVQRMNLAIARKKVGKLIKRRTACGAKVIGILVVIHHTDLAFITGRQLAVCSYW